MGQWQSINEGLGRGRKLVNPVAYATKIIYSVCSFMENTPGQLYLDRVQGYMVQLSYFKFDQTRAQRG